MSSPYGKSVATAEGTSTGNVDDNAEDICIASMSAEEMMSLVFDTSYEAECFYQNYASLRGFTIRKHDQRRRKNNEIVMQKWVCSREGATPFRIQDKESSCKRRSARIGCEASFRINLMNDERWRVSAVNVDHNHDLVPSSQSCFMISNRGISEGVSSAIASMMGVGIRPCDAMRYIAKISGGMSRVSFTQKDLYNHVNASRITNSNCSDLQAAVAYLKAKSNSDSSMALVTHVDGDCVRRCYWADSRSRQDFMYFGDVLAFDSTFKTNAYEIAMVVLVGVNHHHQTIVFGCALLQEECTDAYAWLLDTHTQVMGGKCPISVVTDSDKAMCAAIRSVWPNTRHRLCMWHFQRNMLRNLQDKSLQRLVNDLIFFGGMAEQFEHRWQTLVSEHNLNANRWMQQIYASRELWCEAYLRGHFFAEMRSTQRCERMHAYMKGYLKHKYKLYEFIEHFDRAVADLRHKELEADYMSFHKIPPMATMLKKIEEDAARIFTFESFMRVQEELKKESLFYIVAQRPGNVERVYSVGKYDSGEDIVQVSSMIGCVDIKCSCLHFETVGLPCSHLLHVLKVEGHSKIPEMLVMKRWTKAAKLSAIEPAKMDGPYALTVEDSRQGALTAACKKMCYWGSRSEESFAQMSSAITHLTATMERLALNNSEGDKDTMRADMKIPRKKKRRTMHSLYPIVDILEM